MKHDLFKYTVFILLLNVPFVANAAIEFEGKDKDSKLTVSGELRASYQENNFENKASDQKIKFNTAILNIGYSSPNIFGNFQYRCYQFDTLCDFSALVQANAGYHLNSTGLNAMLLLSLPVILTYLLRKIYIHTLVYAEHDI